MSKKRSGYFSGLVTGALLGAAAYHYLTSTEDGKKIKEKLRGKALKKVDQLSEAIGDLEKKGEEFKKKAKEIQIDLEQKAKNSSTEAAQEAKKKLKEIEGLRERGRKIGRRFFTKNGHSLSSSSSKKQPKS